MTEPKLGSRTRGSVSELRFATLERARRRLEQRLSVWSRREERFALFRLLFVAGVIMILAGMYKSWDASQVFLGWLVFFILFFVLSALHMRLKRVRARCEGLSRVFEAEGHRAGRDWEALRTLRSEHRASLWNSTLCVRAEHPYRSDLDLGGLVPLWLDTCTLGEGAKLLASELVVRGQEPLSEEHLTARRARVEAIASQRKALRRWESYRVGPLAKELEDRRESLSDAPEDSSSQSMEELPEKNPLVPKKLIEVGLWAVILVQLSFWFIVFVPALLQFMSTADVTSVSQPLALFFPLLILGALLWETWKRKILSTQNSIGLRELRVLSALEDVARCVPGRAHQNALVPVRAGQHFRFLRMTLELGEVRRNPIVWLLLNVLFPFDALTFLLSIIAQRFIDNRFEQWWTDVVAFDFHASLARVSTENPEFCWPQRSTASLSATQLGHPLLSAGVRVGNDISLNSEQRCLLLTGSNMAGKSTLLRALGLNVLLAQIGTVVCARSFVAPSMEVLCAIQVSDSLESGASYFYAEVRRLAAVLSRLQANDDASMGNEKLFLIDEIFRGTNNRERFLGSWQVISALLSTGAFGLLTTHDLALTSLESDVPGVRNFHLRETVGPLGRLEFDYLLRNGPCPTTNALIIMQQAGLPVKLDFQPAVLKGELHHV
jgi:hypothetical protein